MKNYVHARLGAEEQALLQELKSTTGESESALIKKGLRFVYEKEVRSRKSALLIAGRSVGKFKGAPPDLSVNKKHLDGFGK